MTDEMRPVVFTTTQMTWIVLGIVALIFVWMTGLVTVISWIIGLLLWGAV